MKTLITLAAVLLGINGTMATTRAFAGIKVGQTTAPAVQAQEFENALIAKVLIDKASGDETIETPRIAGEDLNLTIENVIAEDRKITESEIKDEGYLYFQELTVEDRIAQDNAIIEATVETIQPLALEPTLEDKIAEDLAITESVLPDSAPLQTIDRNTTVAEN